MGRKAVKPGSTTTSKEENNSHQEQCIDTQNQTENENTANGSSAQNVNVDEGSKEKADSINNTVASVAETGGMTSRLRRRIKPVTFVPPRSTLPESQNSSGSKKSKTQELLDSKKRTENEDKDQSRDSNIIDESDEDSSEDESYVNYSSSTAAIALDKINLDVKIDPNVKDRYTDEDLVGEEPTPESPESQRRANEIIARQCRLHPDNKKYNQGPVRPPPVTPGTMVGYTPGGQRHEVDLNFERPTEFNSEYARMQWDYATRINVTRMFHQLETGTFLPDGLDPNIERKYFAEQEMAIKHATAHFEEVARASTSRADPQNTPFDVYALNLTDEDKRTLQLLDAERDLIELNSYSVVRLQDFAVRINEKLRKAADLPLTPLMIKKNPIILDTLETLATQCFHVEVVLSARALVDKIKALFEVPENQEFREYFAAEVEKLKEKTKNMSGFEIMMLTEEPPEIPVEIPEE